jgi:hypothetical protein
VVELSQARRGEAEVGAQSQRLADDQRERRSASDCRAAGTDPVIRAKTDAENVARVKGFAANPEATIRSGLSQVAHGAGSWIGHMHAELNSGDMYRVGAASADVTSVADMAAGGIFAVRGLIRGSRLADAFEAAFRPRVTVEVAAHLVGCVPEGCF